MTRISKVYTRGGDKGQTSLSDGSRVSKADPRLQCYGCVDELNSQLGHLRCGVESDPRLPETDKHSLLRWLTGVQNDLFNLGGDLATPVDKRWPEQIVLGDDDIRALEQIIDLCQQDLEPLREFVLPGGSSLNAELHLARTLCRRAERLAVALSQSSEINPEAIRYLNRLSDLLFVLARWVSHAQGCDEVLWRRDKGLRALLG